MKNKRQCSKCHLPIQKSHRWRTIYHRFLWFTWSTFAHRDCQHPTEIHKYVKRLKGEVPLPFDEPIVLKMDDVDEYLKQKEAMRS